MLLGGPCGRCRRRPRRSGQGWCLDCHAAWMRENRPAYCELPAPARRKAIARSMLNAYVRRGAIERQPCRSCGAAKAEGHHGDYGRPLKVEWLCRGCHLKTHRRMTA